MPAEKSGILQTGKWYLHYSILVYYGQVSESDIYTIQPYNASGEIWNIIDR